MFDVVIRGGMVLDGTAAPAFRADVGLSGGRIAAVGPLDIVVLDPATVADRATYASPREPGVGVEHVFVNGVLVLSGGALTAPARGAPPGRVLRPG